MFNFTTQTVFNSIVAATEAQVASGAIRGANLIDASGNSKTPSLRIGNTRFNAADITNIEIKAPSVELLASVTFDMEDIIPTTANEATTGRIVLYLSLSMNSLDALYANDLVYKGKPLLVEFPVKYGETPDTVAKRVKNIADKYFLFLFGEKIISITTTTDSTLGSETGTVTFEGVNGYLMITKAVMQKYDPEAISVDCCAKQGDFVDVITGVPVIYLVSGNSVLTKDGSSKLYYLDAEGNEAELDTDTQTAILPGLEAFGDYNWIIHNLRLPTATNTNFWAPTKMEMPVAGNTYTLFIITIAKERDGIAGEAVGQRVTSVTNHVLYVAGNYLTASTPANTVYTKLNTLKSAAIHTTADTKFANPFGTAKSLVS